MTTSLDHAGTLLAAVKALRDEVERSTLPLDLPDSAEAIENRTSLLNQLDDYVLPRLASLDAPLLAVIGGSTGAGKSTLVNSILRAQVSRSGVLRPTTTSPVLVHHNADARWFEDTRVLRGLTRVTGIDRGVPEPGTVRLVGSDALPPGMALLDAPDIESVVRANRELSRQLLAAADLWLFVTTAARYADEVPWNLLRQASERGTAVAIVLDRVPREAIDEIRPHLASMLREQGLSTAPIFSVAETHLTDEGWLPEPDVARLRAWLTALASDARARAIVVRQTLTGALDSLGDRTSELVDASAEQQAATDALVRAAVEAYAEAVAAVEEGIKDGTLLRGEVLARWQEFVGTGEFFKKLESGVSRARDRLAASIMGRPAPAEHLDEALQTGVASLVLAEAEGAASGVARRWRESPGGGPLLASRPQLTDNSPELQGQVERLVRDWQGELLDLVREEGQDRRTNARIAAYGLNGLGLFLMLVAFAHTGGLVGAEVGIAGGTAVLAQRVLEAIFGDQAVRDMARKARLRLLEMVEDLYAGERRRYEDAVRTVQVSEDQAKRLRAAEAAVRAAA
jgi:hypothetical protein